MKDKQINDILTRLGKLEKAVFVEKTKTSRLKKENFSGAKGGVLLLLSEGYLDKPRLAREVEDELKQKGYHYSIQVVQTTLNRLSNTKGSLVSMRINGKKTYVKRK